MTNMQTLLAYRHQTVADVAAFFRARGIRQSESWVYRLIAGTRRGSPEEIAALVDFAGVGDELSDWLLSQSVPVIPLVMAGAEA